MSRKTNKRLKVLKDNGIDTSCMLAINGAQTPIAEPSDAVEKAIAEDGFIPERKLWRRFVMAQMFRMLATDGLETDIEAELQMRKNKYVLQMLADEMRSQKRLLSEGDNEAYMKRNLFFNKQVIQGILDEMVPQMSHLKPRHILRHVEKDFLFRHNESPAWRDAFLRAGSYYTMENLVYYHGCTFSGTTQLESARKLEMMDGWSNLNGRDMYQIMLDLIKTNGIDIRAKRIEWAKDYQNKR